MYNLTSFSTIYHVLLASPEFTEWSMFSECDTVCGSGTQTRMRSCVCSNTSEPATGCVGDTIESQCCTDYSNCSMYFTPKRNTLWEELFYKLKLLFSWILWRRFYTSDNAQWSEWFWHLGDPNPNCEQPPAYWRFGVTSQLILLFSGWYRTTLSKQQRFCVIWNWCGANVLSDVILFNGVFRPASVSVLNCSSRIGWRE